MEERSGTANIDCKGRMVLPTKVRKVLGLVKGRRIFIKQDGNRIIQEAIADKDLKKRVDRWFKIVLEMKAIAFSEQQSSEAVILGSNWKCMIHKYARRKTGLS
ncbi:MAG: hypothetical protein ACYC9U_06580 [Nitrososphaerales archaeon]